MYLKIRYFTDMIVAAVALVLLSPILLVTALFISRDKGPVFFRQERVGLNKQRYRVFKFRSMIVDADRYLDPVTRMPTRDRITSVGRFIRKTSIDELPQLINIVIGDMALIGPRPVLPLFLPYMTEAEDRRFDVKPGLTGWAQVNGRNNIRWSERFKLDLFYIENAGFALDLKIVLKTIKIVLGSSDIAYDRNADQVDDITIREG